jgi:hypothetical protein
VLEMKKMRGRCRAVRFLNVRISLRGFEWKRAVGFVALAGMPQHSVSEQRCGHFKLGVSVHFLSFLVCTRRFHLLDFRHGAKYSIGI